MKTQGQIWRRLMLIWIGATVTLVLLGSLSGFYYILAFFVGMIAAGVTVRAVWEMLTASPQEQAALRETAALPFRYFYKGTGIALDPDRKLLHLYAKPRYRVYPFVEVRRWERNVVTGGGVIGGGLAGAAASVQTGMNNERQSGFFVEVRDIDCPRWRIAFRADVRDRELARWMEIMEQHLNDRH